MQKDIRSYIINRIQAPLTTVEQFNWDNLVAPRISELFSPNDLSMLHYYATSLKLSAKTKEKISLIDNVMYSRGFKRFITGTNRITYTFIEDTSFIAKVAYNNVGTTDAPREFKNQMALKPFVPKVFEYTPDGVLSIQERVEPITNREEFLSIAHDIYTLITEWLIGEYVFDDIGTNYFMNYGIRKGFGVVLLDFPYMFKVDYGKLICAAKDNKTTSGTCEGEIDYDSGFNKLYCTKCGTLYRAMDLAKAENEGKILIKPTKGGIEMFQINLKLSGGSKDLNSEVTFGGDNEYVGFMPNKPIAPVLEKADAEELPSEKVKMLEDITKLNVNGVTTEDRPDAVHEIDEVKKSEPEEAQDENTTEEFFDDSKEEENSSSDLESPFTVHDDDEEFKEKAKSIKLDDVVTDEALNKMFSSEESESVDKIKSAIDSLNKEDLIEIIKHVFSKISIDGINQNDLKFGTIEEENDCIEFTVKPEIYYNDELIDNIDISILSLSIPMKYLYSFISDFRNSNNENDRYSGNFIDYAASTINKKDLNQNSINEKVFALIADNGNYLTDKFGNIICVSKIDNKSISNVTLMSSNNKIGETRKIENLKPGAISK